MSIIDDAGGIASLDQLLVGMYKKTGEILSDRHLRRGYIAWLRRI